MSSREPKQAGLLDRRYRLLRVVGYGSLGRVYRAQHVGLDAIVALKELRLPAQMAAATREAARDRFFREARSLTALSHPNLPRVHDYFSHGNACFLVTDFIEGESLTARARRLERLPPREVLSYGLQLCDALAYLHRQRPPLCVGGLSLSDIVVTRQRRAMLVNLGVAYRFVRDTRDRGQAEALAAQLDERGELAGTEVGFRDDVLGLGVVLYELLTGEVPSLDPGNPNSSHELDPRTSSELDVAIATALGWTPARRFATIEDMGRALQAAARHYVPVHRATPSVVRHLSAADTKTSVPASEPAPQAPPSADASGAEPQAGTDVAGAPEDDGVYRAHRASRYAAPTQPARSDHAEAPAAARQGRALMTLAVSTLAFAAAMALALALSLSAGSGASLPDGSRSGASLSSGVQVAPTPAPQRAASQLGGPPSRANPPVKQSIRVAPPTPTPRPTATPQPTSTPTPSPTATPPVTATATPDPTDTPDPTGTPTGTPGPDGTPTPPPAPGNTPTVAPGPPTPPSTPADPASPTAAPQSPTDPGGTPPAADPGVTPATQDAAPQLVQSSASVALAAPLSRAQPPASVSDPSAARTFCVSGARDAWAAGDGSGALGAPNGPSQTTSLSTTDAGQGSGSAPPVTSASAMSSGTASASAPPAETVALDPTSAPNGASGVSPTAAAQPPAAGVSPASGSPPAAGQAPPGWLESCGAAVRSSPWRSVASDSTDHCSSESGVMACGATTEGVAPGVSCASASAAQAEAAACCPAYSSEESTPPSTDAWSNSSPAASSCSAGG